VPFSLLPRYLLGRLYLFAVVLTVDCVLVASIPHTMPLLGPVASFGIVAFAVFLGLGHSRLKALREPIAFNVRLFAAHVLCVAAVYSANLWTLHSLGFHPVPVAAHIALTSLLLLGIALLALACIPLRVWISTLRSTRTLWLLASLAGVVAWCLRYPFQSFWNTSNPGHGRFLQVIAFDAVNAVLRLFLPNVVVDPSTFVIGTPRFAVFIAEQCSGMEGLGLVFVFTAVWLWYFRKESRFPQALLLIPCALGCVWLLNVARISAIVLIGNAGAPDIAMVGFHSQAGWIAFTSVALAFSMATRKLSWVRRDPVYASGSCEGGVSSTASVPEQVQEEAGESPATAAYLVPFLAILAASFVSKAASGYFEWLYPLRFIAAAIALWHFRHEYKKLDWRFSWIAPLAGAAIFLVWIAPELWTHEHSSSVLGAALTALSPAARGVWITFRVAAAAVTVPIAEELAFRGYLTRRFMNRHFDSVPFTALTLLSVGFSSVIFGLMHGQHWLAGIVAGLAYAAALKWRGRIGDAIAAHATSNLLLAAWVLLRGDWAQW
jgi:exosortase E/protease (VPEID-CTERM system)